MNQYKTPAHPKIMKTDVIDVHSDIPWSRNVLCRMYPDHISKLSLFDYHLFGHWFSSELAAKKQLEHYKKFVRQYNRFVEERFREEIEFINEVYRISTDNSLFRILALPNFLIQDRTLLFKNDEFISEKSLETCFTESSKDLFDRWNIKNQHRVGNGICDIFIETMRDRLAIELKKGTAKVKDVYQTFAYSASSGECDVALIAHHFPHDVIEVANQLGVNCYKYELLTLYGEMIPYSVLLHPVNQVRKINFIESCILDVNHCDGHLIEYKGFPSASSTFLRSKKILKEFETALNVAWQKVSENTRKKIICPCCRFEIPVEN